jgi:hypothetical protein
MLHPTPKRDIFSGLGHNGDVQSQPINLDCMPLSDLEIAVEHPALHLEVKKYANILMTAKSFRLAGMISLAVSWESKADAVYEQIPEQLRW